MTKEKKEALPEGVKPAISKEVPIFIIIFFGFFILLGGKMGASNMFNTMMNTAHDLLINTVFYIMAIAVLAGAVSALWSEFGVVYLFNKIMSPLIKPVYGLPGASAVGIFTTYLSDNPAILTLAEDNNFRRFFKKYQLPALCNIGTAFGMGMIITTCMIGIHSPAGENFALAALVGNLGAIIGSIVSTRLMLRFSAKLYGKEADCECEGEGGPVIDIHRYRRVHRGSVGTRFIDALLEGGKSGVDMGLAIIPGVLIICTLVMMLTNGMPEGGYTGGAYEGIGLLPWLGLILEHGGSHGFGVEPHHQEVDGVRTDVYETDRLALSAAHAICPCWPSTIAGNGTVSPHPSSERARTCRRGGVVWP